MFRVGECNLRIKSRKQNLKYYMKDKIIELLKQYENTYTQSVYTYDYDELADEVVKLFCQLDVSVRSEQLSCETCIFNTHSWSEDYPCTTCCDFDKHQAK